MNIDLAKTFFVMNGMSKSYFGNRIVSQTTNVSRSSSYGASTSYGSASSYGSRYAQNAYGSGSSYAWAYGGNVMQSGTVQYVEREIVSIAPHSYIYIPGREEMDQIPLFKDCDFKKDPPKFSSFDFKDWESPYMFSNYIAYFTEKDPENVIKIENKFFVKNATNYNLGYSKIYETFRKDECGKELEMGYRKLNVGSPDKYYMRYSVGM